MPIRWRLAVVSAGLTGIILLLFAVVVGSFTVQRIRNDFTAQNAARLDAVRQRLDLRVGGDTAFQLKTDLEGLRAESGTVIQVFQLDENRYTLLGSSPPGADIGSPASTGTRYGDYRISTRTFQQPVNGDDGKPLPYTVTLLRGLKVPEGNTVFKQRTTASPLTATIVIRIGRSYASVERTTRRIETALGLGVFAGALLALLAGLAVGHRAMRPVRRMTSTARHIARTRDLDAKMPVSRVNDEIAELAGTLQDMLDELAAAQAKVDDTLQRQREFVADASHELRTPLTSVQANLELLALSTEGDDREAAESALRSSRRMRRLVADLLLLARMDARREASREPVDLDRAILEAVDELEPQFGNHEIVLDIEPVTVDGVRDELVRMVANLVGNALRHTEDGTEIRVQLRADGKRGELVVEDDGPGIPADLRERIFDRFVRRGGEGAGSTGIGLAIVRAAAQRHGGDVRVEPTAADGSGARFVVSLAVIDGGDHGGDPATLGDDGADGDGGRGNGSGPAAGPDPRDPDGPSGGDGAGERLIGSPRRAAERIRRRLRSTRPRGPASDNAAERLGGAAPDEH